MDSRSIAPVTLAGAALCALALVGCKAKTESQQAAGNTAAPTSTPAATAPSTPSVGPNVVTVHARDFAFDAPSQIQSGMTTFHLINDGPGIHHMTIVRLDSGKTLADAAEAVKSPGPPPRWMTLIGGPNAPDPGSDANATLDMATGNYALICFVDVPGGVPHFAKGMVHPLTVVASTTAAAPAPTADNTISLSDYKFALSKPLTSGRHTFEVRNSAAQPHEVELIRLAPGKTADDMLKWFSKPNGPPPGSAIGGVAGTATAAPLYFTADLTPADYVLLCFIPDARDGKPHFMHGMMQTMKVS